MRRRGASNQIPICESFFPVEVLTSAENLVRTCLGKCESICGGERAGPAWQARVEPQRRVAGSLKSRKRPRAPLSAAGGGVEASAEPQDLPFRTCRLKELKELKGLGFGL